MPYTVVHGDPGAALGAAGTAGQGQFAQEQQRIAIQQKQVDRDFFERRRQFDINAAMQMDARAQQDAQFQQQQQMAAMGQQLDLANQAANREAQMYGQQAGFDHQLAMQDNAWAQEAGLMADKELGEQVKGLRGRNYDEEGKVLYNQLAGEWRAVQSQRDSLLPRQYLDLQDQFRQKLESAGLDGYEIEEPSAEADFRKSLTREDGKEVAPMGQPLQPGWHRQRGVRNNVPTFERVWIKDPLHTTQQDLEARRVVLPNGSFGVYSENGELQEFKPAASKVPTEMENQEIAMKIKAAEQKLRADLYIKSLESAMKMQTPISTEDPATGEVTNTKIDAAAVQGEATKIMQGMMQAIGAGLPGDEQEPYTGNAVNQNPTVPHLLTPEIDKNALDIDQAPTPAKTQAALVGYTFTANGKVYQKTGPNTFEEINLR